MRIGVRLGVRLGGLQIGFRTAALRVAAGAIVACLCTSYVVSGFGGTQPRPEMQRVPQFENERAVSWKSIIPPHTESTLHRHDRYRTIVAIVGGDLKTVTAAGEATVTRYETGKSYWQAPMPPGAMHKDVNDTDKTIELIVVELK